MDPHELTGGSRLDSVSAQAEMTRKTVASLSLAFPSWSAVQLAELRARCDHAKTWSCDTHQKICRLNAKGLREMMTEVQISGMYLVEEQLARGKSLILATPHYGLYLLGSAVIVDRLKGTPLMTMLSPEWRNASVAPSLKALRSIDPGLGFAEGNARGTIKALRHLRRPGTLFILYDQLLSLSSTLYVPLLGRFFKVMSGTSFLARKADSVLIPYFCHLIDGHQLTLTFKPALFPPVTDDFQEDVANLAGELFGILEAQLHAFPEFWNQWQEYSDRTVRDFVLPDDRSALLKDLRIIEDRFSHNESLSKATELWRTFLS